MPFVAAVSVNDAGHPIHMKLDLVSGFTSNAIGKWARASLLPSAAVCSDGLACFTAVTGAGCLHYPMIVGTFKPRDLPEFKWVNTMLGNLKTTLAGAFHALNYRKYATNYLAAFAYRSTVDSICVFSSRNSSPMSSAPNRHGKRPSELMLSLLSNQVATWRVVGRPGAGTAGLCSYAVRCLWADRSAQPRHRRVARRGP